MNSFFAKKPHVSCALDQGDRPLRAMGDPNNTDPAGAWFETLEPRVLLSSSGWLPFDPAAMSSADPAVVAHPTRSADPRSATSNPDARAVWVSSPETHDMIFNTNGERDAYLDFMQAKGITTVYLFVGNQNPVGNPAEPLSFFADQYAQIVSDIHSRAMEVFALIGHSYDPNAPSAWQDAASTSGPSATHFQNVLSYNDSRSASEQFDGVNLDLEPWTFPEWDTGDRAVILSQYLDLSQHLMQQKQIQGPGLQVGPAAPFWFDEHAVTWNGQEKPTNEHVQDIYDYIAIQDYRDTALAGSFGSITSLAQEEMAYADTLAAQNIHKPVVIGVETKASSEGQYVTFFEEGEHVMEHELALAKDHFLANHEGFGGFAIHDFGNYLQWTQRPLTGLNTVAHGDFNNDGYDDLAIGVPGEDIGTAIDAGAVNVLYGSDNGLTAAGDQFWHQNIGTVWGHAEPGDRFGAALAVGDFNNDGYDDLAIGVPGEDLGNNTIADAGMVHVLYGSDGVGLTANGDQDWHQNKPGVDSSVEEGDAFGATLATGDLNNDGIDDLAIGVPGEDIGTAIDAGAVNVLYGGSPDGLSATGDQFWHQNIGTVWGDAEPGDRFGATLAVGDFNNDGSGDLAIGVPGEDLGNNTIADAGMVHVLYGSDGVGLTANGDQDWHQNKPGIDSSVEEGDAFGASLATGDLNNDGIDDLAIGVPGEDIAAAIDAGAVNVLYGGSPDGLSATGDQFWHQNIGTVWGDAEPGDRFGSVLAIGDFNNDGNGDLAIGVPGEDLGNNTIVDVGMVHVLYGSDGVGLTANGDQDWHQNKGGVKDTAELGDGFGASLTAGDFNGDGKDDLAIGAPGEDLANNTILNAGVVHVLYGSGGVGLTANGDQNWHQNRGGVKDTAEEGDGFGGWLHAFQDFRLTLLLVG